MLSIGDPINGEHHDLYNIKETLDEIIGLLNDADIECKGLFLNADSGFDGKKLRDMLDKKEMMVILKRILETGIRRMKNTLIPSSIKEDSK